MITTIQELIDLGMAETLPNDEDHFPEICYRMTLEGCRDEMIQLNKRWHKPYSEEELELEVQQLHEEFGEPLRKVGAFRVTAIGYSGSKASLATGVYHSQKENKLYYWSPNRLYQVKPGVWELVSSSRGNEKMIQSNLLNVLDNCGIDLRASNLMPDAIQT